MATKTEPNGAAVPTKAVERPAPAKVISKFTAMQRIDKLIRALPVREREGVLAWLFSEWGPRHDGMA